MINLLTYTAEQITAIISAIVAGIVAIIGAVSTLLNQSKKRKAKKASSK